MKSTFIDLTGKLPDTIFLSAFERVGEAVSRHGISALVVGATARDLVPFGGGMTNATGEIAWPPAEEVVMSVLGFQEAMDHALRVRVSTSPLIEVSVASPAGIALLKLVSSSERPLDVRQKDAQDLEYLMGQYEVIPEVIDRLYGEA